MDGPPITICPPGYAHGYSPEGEISALDRDTSTVTASIATLQIAGKCGYMAAKRYENQAQARLAALQAEGNHTLHESLGQQNINVD